MITSDAALYTPLAPSALLTSVRAATTTCGCGQELFEGARRHCPRCGCCLT